MPVVRTWLILAAVIGLLEPSPSSSQSLLEKEAKQKVAQFWDRVVPACSAHGDTRFFLDVQKQNPSMDIYSWKRMWQFNHVSPPTFATQRKLSFAEIDNGLELRAASELGVGSSRSIQNFTPLDSEESIGKRIAAGEWSLPWTAFRDGPNLSLVLEKDKSGWHYKFVPPGGSILDPQLFARFADLAGQIIGGQLGGVPTSGVQIGEVNIEQLASQQMPCPKAASTDPFAYQVRTEQVTVGQYVCPGVEVTYVAHHEYVHNALTAPMKIVKVKDPGRTVVLDDNGKAILTINHGPVVVTVDGGPGDNIVAREHIGDQCPGFPIDKEAEAKTKDTPAPPGLSVLKIQSELAPTNNPTALTTLYLMKADFESTVSKSGFALPAGMNIRQAFTRFCATETPDCARLQHASVADAAASATSDRYGDATFPAVPPGEYYVYLFGQDRFKKWFVWYQKITLPQGKTTFSASIYNTMIIRPSGNMPVADKRSRGSHGQTTRMAMSRIRDHHLNPPA